MSSSDSPFSTELPLAAKLSESADSHFSAVSKEKRVRVDASKKRLTTMRPRSAGTFLDLPLADRAHRVGGVEQERDFLGCQALDAEEVLRTKSGGGHVRDRAARGIIPAASPGSRLRRSVGLLEHDLDDLAAGGRHALADVVRLDRKLAVAAVDQHGQAHGARSPEVDDAVERRPDRPAGVQHVVAEQDRPAVQVEVDLGLLQEGLRSDHRQVVAVEGDVERADGKRLLDELTQARRQPDGQGDAPGPDADEGQVRKVLLALGDLVRHAVDHAADPLGVQDPGLFDEPIGHMPGPAPASVQFRRNTDLRNSGESTV